MFDVFYIGTKPGLFPHERAVKSCQEACQRSRTSHCWVITYLVDYSGFDFLWNPVPWEAHYRHAWASQHQPDSETYLLPCQGWNETRYHDTPALKRLLCKQNWHVPAWIDPNSVDYTWHPNPLDPPYIYHFPSQHQVASGVTYAAPEATEIKLVDTFVVRSLSCKQNWHVPAWIDPNSVDYTWHPNPLDPPYIYHFPSQHQVASGVTYAAPEATEIKLVDTFVVRSLSCKQNWHVPAWIDPNSVDYTWHPNPLDPPCTYHFESKWHWDRIGGPEYRMPNTIEIKYLDSFVADTCCDLDCWYVPDWIDPASIDYTWVPCPADPPYIYEFPVEWGWDHIGGPEYRVPNATEKKYVTQFVARTRPDPDQFEILDHIDLAGDVLRWRPNPTETPYIYVFGNQWHAPEQRASVRYHVPGAVEYKYVKDIVAQRLPLPDNFVVHVSCEFDWSWEPDPGDPPYIYVFGNQWWSAEVMPTVEYRVFGATEHKYVNDPCARLLVSDQHWITVATQEFEFDQSWCPDPGDPPYIYVFGNQWHSAKIMPTIEYHVPGATERKFMDQPQACLRPCQEFWSVPEELNVDNIDFSWCPDPGSPPYIYHFGTDYQDTVGLTYTVPGFTELKFAGEVPRIQQSQPVVSVLEIFYMDHSNAASSSRFEALQQRYPHIQRVRYVNSTIDTIKRCVARCKGSKFWIISSRNDYTDFDFAWHAQTWQSSMIHVFGTQWNKWSDTFLINRWEFERHSRWARDIEEFPNLNFVTDQLVLFPSDATDIYVIDHGDSRTRIYLSEKYRTVQSVRYFDNYLDTIRRLIATVESDYIWITSGLCDYSRFDFSWQPEVWQRAMLHVFPSDDQKFGDTFYVPVKELKSQIDNLRLLEWFDTINFCEDQVVPRWPMPVYLHEFDSHVEATKAIEFDQPLALFTDRNVDVKRLPTVSVWQEKTKTIVPLDAGGSAVIVPKNSIPFIETQLYDYPHIDKTQKNLFDPTLQDVIFISYDEPDADKNWEKLQKICPRSKRIHGVNGMEIALETAADLSSTPWYYAVFAKTEVMSSFKFDFVPDRLQQPKHYIFNCLNAVNGLEYGHMGIVLYNCKGIKSINRQCEFGIDYTLSFEHASVPILSCVGNFNTTPYHTWRTAFRETVKLAYFESQSSTVEGQYRLNTWTSKAQGDHAEWCLNGAQDGLDFFQHVNGQVSEIKKSFRWGWLRTYFTDKWGDID